MCGGSSWCWRVALCAVLGLGGCGRQTVVAPVASEVVPAKNPAEAAAENQGEFAFPRDACGALLLRVLPPQDTAGQSSQAAAPVPWQAPRRFEVPNQPLPPEPAPGLVPALTLKDAWAPLRPHLLSSEDLEMPLERVQLPAVPLLPMAERARIAAVDIEQPVALPILAQPVAERASLEDPTMDASTAIALAAVLPQRAQPVPFLRLTVPEPYENRRPLTLAIPPEATDPWTATPQTPKP
jgi:hypothetical protein